MLDAQWPATTGSMTPDTSIIEAGAGEDAWHEQFTDFLNSFARSRLSGARNERDGGAQVKN
jgi:hypothetical protein